MRQHRDREHPHHRRRISATGADGTLYTLTIPGDALTLPTDISLTPVASVAGLPTSGDITYAVQLEPSGLQLDDFATLTITPTTPLPIDQQIPFGYEGDGADMFLALPVVTDPRIQLQVLHFSGYGVTKGLLADMEPIRQRLGGSAEARLESQLAEGLQALKGRDDLAGTAAMAALFDAFLKDFKAQVVESAVWVLRGTHARTAASRSRRCSSSCARSSSWVWPAIPSRLTS